MPLHVVLPGERLEAIGALVIHTRVGFRMRTRLVPPKGANLREAIVTFRAGELSFVNRLVRACIHKNQFLVEG